MEKSGFRRLFWGFLFTMLDFKIMGVDIFPDIVGYFFFLSGLNLLILKDNYFENARKFCLPLLILSIFSIYDPPRGAFDSLSGFSGIALVISIAVTILDLIFVYNICRGVENLAKHEGNTLLEQEAENRWRQYLGFFIASLASFTLVLIPSLLLFALIALIVYAIMLVFLMTGFMSRCREAFEGDTMN